MSTGRRLRTDERELITAMLGGRPRCAELISSLEARTVEDMQDGRTGSIRFLSGSELRHLGETVAEAEYTDDDGALVNIALNTDSNGGLYEVDFWKVDFSALRRYPSARDLRVK